ncbi:hypothetical protein DN069_27030 [Streptacidiphilus pinicola]|uniref:Allene oxide cyclase barrel-like domain-containing protein n=1 Tax=Streptacidiphilus pinicola TaxID=2219663 RepID=A0A2X0IGH1_9ACTN|nr:hypothetical protein [Streptacidiphilus pinicola]RAG82511.1 hypothetical protein DN069_27030 [Streptacidiphilus pinicola]
MKTSQRTRRTVGALLAGGLALGLALPAAAASAAAPQDQPGPWQPYRSGTFTDPAGTACAFTLTGVPVSDREEIRTLAVDSSGEPTEQEIKGQLVVRYTNESNGRSADENLTGVGWLYYHADGSQTWVISGHFGMGIHPGNPYSAPGYWILNGRITLQIDTAHHSYVSAHDGTTEDLCAELT